jgi:hypothetical protein
VSVAAATVADMRARLYPALSALSFLGLHHRTDIGDDFGACIQPRSMLEPEVRNAS